MMKKIINNFWKSSSSYVISTSLSILINKLLAIQLGPSGLAVYSQLKQLNQLLTTVTTFNSQNFIVRKIATRENVIDYILVIIVASSIALFLVACAMILYPNAIGLLIFKKTIVEIPQVLIILCVSVLLTTSNIFITAIINGRSEIAELSKIQIVGSVFATLSTLLLISKGISIYYFPFIIGFQSFWSVLLGLYHLRKKGFFKEFILPKSNLKAKINRFYELFLFSATLFLTGFIGNLTVTIIRSLYINSFGLRSGGVLDSAITVSTMLINILITSVTIFYLPDLSKSFTVISKQANLNNHVVFTTITSSLIVLFAICFSSLIIVVLYSSEFNKAVVLLRFMLVGEFLKATYFNFGMFLIAFERKKVLLIFDISLNVFFLVLTAVLLPFTGAAYPIAFIIGNFIYLIVAYYYIKKEFKVRVYSKVIIFWLISFFSIIIIFLSINLPIVITIIVSLVIAAIYFFSYYKIIHHEYKLINF